MSKKRRKTNHIAPATPVVAVKTEPALQAEPLKQMQQSEKEILDLVASGTSEQKARAIQAERMRQAEIQVMQQQAQ